MGVKGTNPSGYKLLAQELIDGKLPKESSSPITITTSSGRQTILLHSLAALTVCDEDLEMQVAKGYNGYLVCIAIKG